MIKMYYEKQKGKNTMQAYLFVHFREKTTPDGEQVYFGLSKDGFHWEAVNEGNPVLWAYHGDKGVRDFTVTRAQNGKFYILATDLSLSYGMRNQYHNFLGGDCKKRKQRSCVMGVRGSCKLV